MGNIESQCRPEVNGGSAQQLDEQGGRIIDQVDFQTWSTSTCHQYGFAAPCGEYHDNAQLPYSCSKCYSLEVKVGRRRSVQFRKDLTRYTAELERFVGGRHSLHIRDHMTNTVVIIPLVKVANALPELDILYDPVLTVIAYHCDIMAITVQEKTKNIPKVMIFCDVKHACEVGQYVAQLNYNNLSGGQIDCCISPDSSTFILYVVEDHYDEFHTHFHAIQFNSDCKPIVICEEQLSRSTWYEPGIHIAFLPESDNTKLVVLGEKPSGLAERFRYVIIYDLTKKDISHGVELVDNLYPVSIGVSPNGTWVATMARCPREYEGCDTESYMVKLYTADNLTLVTHIQFPFTIKAFNYMPMCNKLIFSLNSKLIALPSTSDEDNLEFDWEYGAYYRPSEHQGTSGVTMRAFRLPVVDLTLKALCRAAVLDHCSYTNAPQLPIPTAMKDYVQFKD